MRIGLTFDLRSEYLALGWSAEDAAEFDTEATVESIESGLRELGHEVVRVGRCEALARRLAAGERWDLVFNFCEGARGRSREAQVPALLECFDIPYTFCDPLTAVPHARQGPGQARGPRRGLADAGLPRGRGDRGPRRASPCRSRSSPSRSPRGPERELTRPPICRDRAALEAACRRLLERFRQPALVEEFLPGREVTVGLLGTGRDARVLGVLEVRLLETAEKGVYSYQNKEQCEQRVEYRLVEPGPFRDEAARVALGCYRAARLPRRRAPGPPRRRAGTAEFHRSEPARRPAPDAFRPAHPQHPRSGTRTADLLAEILRSAMKRAGGPEGAAPMKVAVVHNAIAPGEKDQATLDVVEQADHVRRVPARGRPRRPAFLAGPRRRRRPSESSSCTGRTASSTWSSRSRATPLLHPCAAALWELIGVPHTGSPSSTLDHTTDKALAKTLLAAAGIATAEWAICRRDVRRLAPRARPVDPETGDGGRLDRH